MTQENRYLGNTPTAHLVLGDGTRIPVVAIQNQDGTPIQIASADQGGKADQRASWYDATASMVSLLKLLIAAYVGAGSRKYYYGDGTSSTGNTPVKQLWKEEWVLFGVTRTKTYVYTADGQLDTESDWA